MARDYRYLSEDIFMPFVSGFNFVIIYRFDAIDALNDAIEFFAVSRRSLFLVCFLPSKNFF